MMMGEARVQVFDFVSSLSKVMDLMSPRVVNHQLQVAYIAHSIATEMGVPIGDLQDVAVAGALHDIGAFSLQDRLDTLQFEGIDPHLHAEVGYLLLNMFEPFAGIARMVRFHHVAWKDGEGATARGEAVPLESHILHLADRIAVLIDSDQPMPAQAAVILPRIRSLGAAWFHPDAIEAFERLAGREYFWYESGSRALESVLRNRVRWQQMELNMDRLTDLAYMLCRLIDFRSEYTATHSSGVAASAVELARLVGFSDQECRLMRVAAYLHDLGKLAVPLEILEKPGKLEDVERDVMRSHAFYTYHILEPIEGLDVITTWSSMHQERLNGSGYPFHRVERDLPLGARVLAVADVFTALTEDRPYRKGMPKEHAISTLKRMASENELDSAIVSLLRLNFDAINVRRIEAQAAATEDYRQFLCALD
ncbi:MAG: HD domain-containing protein [FCB group bacterium]|jgi:HD-GYP domain-containing protein (c-di-GMP phosphodiesterase class II)|nr:HD domain-containing protein [FCB group bacterium]